MVASVNYSTAVTVNGFSCRNCADVTLAKRNIDPSHPGSGPFDVNAGGDPSRSANDPKKIAAAKAVADAHAKRVVGYSPVSVRMGETAPGSLIDLSA